MPKTIRVERKQRGGGTRMVELDVSHIDDRFFRNNMYEDKLFKTRQTSDIAKQVVGTTTAISVDWSKHRENELYKFAEKVLGISCEAMARDGKDSITQSYIAHGLRSIGRDCHIAPTEKQLTKFAANEKTKIKHAFKQLEREKEPVEGKKSSARKSSSKSTKKKPKRIASKEPRGKPKSRQPHKKKSSSSSKSSSQRKKKA